ncbi:hypothetical protein ONS95_014369 [Cadophora gregata]|uniref:uncharacterized protein n=1 Tax=Cadophora gregata TaxID=51156 RepID=UPI0026DC5E8C|nr:uncharacterized protein ONS95_014369 [Cadophora gregata]KAK0112628.1 hypothetical protein ONS95_014369 [Cadophora gregata]
MAESPEYKISPVTPSDLPSIGTLHARAFHPKSTWHLKVFPPSLSPWWSTKYSLDIASPNMHILKISPSPPPADSPHTVTGLLFLRKYSGLDNNTNTNTWLSFPPPPEIVDPQTYKALIDAMVEYREKYMYGREHFCIEHFGVDAEFQEKGLGSALLGRACGIADADGEGLDVFVQANEFAEGFYRRFGFESVGRRGMPGGLVECFLVRREGGGRGV